MKWWMSFSHRECVLLREVVGGYEGARKPHGHGTRISSRFLVGGQR